MTPLKTQAVYELILMWAHTKNGRPEPMLGPPAATTVIALYSPTYANKAVICDRRINVLSSKSMTAAAN
jgi:hypothetical protein